MAKKPFAFKLREYVIIWAGQYEGFGCWVKMRGREKKHPYRNMYLTSYGWQPETNVVSPGHYRIFG